MCSRMCPCCRVVHKKRRKLEAGGIGRPVDVVEIARKLFMPENKVGPMKMGTERVRPSQGGAPIDLGSIELTVSK